MKPGRKRVSSNGQGGVRFPPSPCVNSAMDESLRIMFPEMTQTKNTFAVRGVAAAVQETTFYALPDTSCFHTGSIRNGHRLLDLEARPSIEVALRHAAHSHAFAFFELSFVGFGRGRYVAKVAKVAKVSSPGPRTLAGLATLAGGRAASGDLNFR